MCPWGRARALNLKGIAREVHSTFAPGSRFLSKPARSKCPKRSRKFECKNTLRKTGVAFTVSSRCGPDRPSSSCRAIAFRYGVRVGSNAQQSTCWRRLKVDLSRQRTSSLPADIATLPVINRSGRFLQKPTRKRYFADWSQGAGCGSVPRLLHSVEAESRPSERLNQSRQRASCNLRGRRANVSNPPKPDRKTGPQRPGQSYREGCASVRFCGSEVINNAASRFARTRN